VAVVEDACRAIDVDGSLAATRASLARVATAVVGVNDVA